MRTALYRKWRPKSFDDVISQKAITTTLANEVKSGSIAHAFLFTGMRGTGKTTCARILAAAVNCLDPENGEPCRKCDICKGIETGSMLDIVEIDAASNNGVDDIRALREESGFTPLQCKYKIYIIDEAHMLSAAAFNALLKLLEEPPPHIIFILATTESHKIPATIISRCQRFNFRPIESGDIAQRLLYISGEEGVGLSADAAGLIAKLAEGAMRDAISILDQCLAFSENVSLQTVIDVAGVSGHEYLFAISEAVSDLDACAGLMRIDDAYKSSKDFDRLCVELLSHFRNLMLAKMTANDELLSCAPDGYKRYREAAAMFSVQDLIHCVGILEEALNKLSRSEQKRILMEVCIVKLCAPKASGDPDGILRRIEKLEKLEKPEKPEKPGKSEKSEKAESGKAYNHRINPANDDLPFEANVLSVPETTPVEQDITPPESISPPCNDPPPEQIVPPAKDPAPASTQTKTLDMQRLVKQLEKISAGLAPLLSGAQINVSNKKAELSSDNMMLPALLKSADNRKALLEAVETQTGENIAVFLDGENLGHTTAPAKTARKNTAKNKNPRPPAEPGEADANSASEIKTAEPADNDELSKLSDEIKNLNIELNIT
ncbi:MAG: DNA polymerase III subunit gamma/tau [Oscillospiraceae bacterium]|nr:DNA polymerase III subunit gamma/tau [Oscillospiraceae bacterium]